MLLTSFLPLAALILAVLGSILGGLATPSEAASVGAMGGLLLAVAYRALTWQRLRESVYLTMRTTAMVCWLFVGSYTFSSVFSYLGGEQIISEFVEHLNLSPVTFLLLAQLIILTCQKTPAKYRYVGIIYSCLSLGCLQTQGLEK